MHPLQLYRFTLRIFNLYFAWVSACLFGYIILGNWRMDTGYIILGNWRMDTGYIMLGNWRMDTGYIILGYWNRIGYWIYNTW